jgi:hypothetical protein
MSRLYRLWSRMAVVLVASLTIATGISALQTEPVHSASDEDDEQAGVVIYFDEDQIEYHLIDLPEEGLSGIELLELTGRDLELQPFGGLGEAVCSIEGTGCPGSDCFCESFSNPAYYWNFYMLEDGQWLPQLSGAGQHTVEPGEIHGWAWSSGSPDLPAITLDDFESPNEVDQATSVATPTPQPTATPEVEASGNDDQDAPTATPGGKPGSSEPESDNETQCLQFIGFLSVVTAIAAWAGFRRYRHGASP